MFRDDTTLTPEMFAFSPRDLVGAESDAWLYIDLFESLDLSKFREDYTGQGEWAVHPELMLRTIFYGLTHGVASGRKLEEACYFDNRFIVLSGNQKPSYRTFYRFVVRHERRLNALFVQVVRLAQKMGLASLGRVAIDGSRFKANTSRHKAMSYERMQKAVKEIAAELEKLKADLAESNGKEQTETNLPEEIRRREKRLAKIAAAKKALEEETQGEVEAKAQKSFADHDALPMAKPKDGFMYGYNCQAAVDGDHQIIVAAELHDSAADTQALVPVLDKVEENCGKNPNEVLADAGYKSAENLEAIPSETTAYIAVGQGEFNPERNHLEAIKFDDKVDGYRCAAGKLLPTERRRKDGSRRLILSAAFCAGCQYAATCPLQKYAEKNSVFNVPEESRRLLIMEHQQRMRSNSGRQIYRFRKSIVEPVFGNIKNKRLRIGVRGEGKVACWWKMVCTAHNIEKIVARAGLVTDWCEEVAERISTRIFGRSPKILVLLNPPCVTSS